MSRVIYPNQFISCLVAEGLIPAEGCVAIRLIFAVDRLTELQYTQNTTAWSLGEPHPGQKHHTECITLDKLEAFTRALQTYCDALKGNK